MKQDKIKMELIAKEHSILYGELGHITSNILVLLAASEGIAPS
jgi:hypothetical protein